MNIFTNLKNLIWNGRDRTAEKCVIWRDRTAEKCVILRRKGWTYRAIGEELGIRKDRAMEICFREMGSLETKKYNYKRGERA